MSPALPPLNRFYFCSDYSVSYRRIKHLQQTSQTLSDYTLLAVTSGQLGYEVGATTGVLQNGEAVILEPNLSNTISGKDVAFLRITLSSALVISHAMAMRLVPPQSTVAFKLETLKVFGKFRELLAEFAEELSAEKPGREIIMHALVEQLLVYTLRHHATTRRSNELELSRVGLIDRRIRRSVELMHAQLDQDLSLREIAAASFLSPFHFARLFKKLTGTTPHNYLAQLRAGRAKLLLADTDLSITAIGARVGYLSASHFTKAFRLATGTTPREFRKALIP